MNSAVANLGCIDFVWHFVLFNMGGIRDVMKSIMYIFNSSISTGIHHRVIVVMYILSNICSIITPVVRFDKNTHLRKMKMLVRELFDSLVTPHSIFHKKS